MQRMKIARMATVGLCVAAIFSGIPSVSASADNPPRPTLPSMRCYPGMACIYYNRAMMGAVAPLHQGADNHDVQVFNPGTGNGQGEKIWRAAASADNRSESVSYCIHTNMWSKGAYDVVYANTALLGAEASFNNNASSNYYPRHEGGGGHFKAISNVEHRSAGEPVKAAIFK
ncbi:hypothetical protein [Streptomyces sp. NPDC002537]